MAYTYFDPAQHSLEALIAALLGPNSQHFSVVDNSISLRYGSAANSTSLSFYSGALPFEIGTGLLLTSGDGAPPMANTSEEYTEVFQTNYLLNAAGLTEVPSAAVQDDDLQAAVERAFPSVGSLHDITALEFTINVTDPQMRGIAFDILFGSDEYPEYVDDFVDIAGVFINGKNYALFNGAPEQPLSVLQKNLAGTLPNFMNNGFGGMLIEYDGLSYKLQIVAPVEQGMNTVKIAVGDTDDALLDSGIFVSALRGVDHAGFGLAQPLPIVEGPAPFHDFSGNQIYDLSAGTVSIAINGGDDVVNGGPGLNKVYFNYSVGSLQGYALEQGAVTVVGPSGATQMVDIERVQFKDLLVALDTEKGENTWNAFSLLHAAFGAAPGPALLSQWTAEMDRSDSLTELAQKVLEYYAPQRIADSALISLLYQNLAGIAPDAGQVAAFEAMIGPGRTFAGQADLLAYASQLDLGGTVTQLIGVLQVLDSTPWLEPDPWTG